MRGYKSDMTDPRQIRMTNFTPQNLQEFASVKSPLSLIPTITLSNESNTQVKQTQDCN